MKQKFLNLLKRINAKGNIEESYYYLKRLHSKPHRHYHNFNHIKQCLNELDYINNKTIFPEALEFAIWYHDSIYTSKRQDNEQKSALLAYNTALSLSLSKIFAQKAKELVLATKHDTSYLNNDEKIITDIDLTIFGKSEKRFDEYCRDIKKEYSYVPFKKYKKTRIKIIKKFLSKKSIYQIDFFKQKYEENARKNLSKAIKNLKNKIICD
jgi:predicted metal-dependent HD superfamily phosphohydrolase